LVDIEPQGANFSIVLADAASDRGARPLDLLYRGTCLLTRAPEPGAVFAAFATYLGALATGPDLSRLEAELVVGPSAAALLPPSWQSNLVFARRQFEQRGARHIPLPFVPIDPRTGDVVLEGRRWPVVLVATGTEGEGRAAAAGRLARWLVPPGPATEDALRGIKACVDGADLLPIAQRPTDEMLSAVAAAVTTARP
jgi:hypothetical protein